MALNKRLSKSKPMKSMRAVTVSKEPWDLGADGPANRKGVREVKAVENSVSPDSMRITKDVETYRRRETWVARYLRKGKLSPDQARAADALFSASAGVRDRDPLAAMGIRAQGDGYDPMCAAIDKRDAFRRMWGMIPNDCRPMVERVVLNDMSIPASGPATRERYMDQLRRGLDAISY